MIKFFASRISLAMVFFAATSGLLAGFMILSLPALAQDAVALDDAVVIPWGQWLAAIAAFIAANAAAFVAALFRHLPEQWAATGRTARVDQLLERAISYGCNTVAGASRDKAMTVAVANDVIEQAAEFALGHGPKAILDWLGGEKMLREKIIARLDVVQEEAVAP